MENSGYNTKRNLNKRRRAERRRLVRAQANILKQVRIVPVLGAIENVLENEPVNGPKNVPHGRPRIIENRPFRNNVRILPALFKEGKRNPPPEEGDRREKFVCNKCRVKYKDEFCITCVKLKFAIVIDDEATPNKELEYIPETKNYQEFWINKLKLNFIFVLINFIFPLPYKYNLEI